MLQVVRDASLVMVARNGEARHTSHVTSHLLAVEGDENIVAESRVRKTEAAIRRRQTASHKNNLKKNKLQTTNRKLQTAKQKTKS